MASSLHVSLPDEMREFVDYRTNGKKHFATPSEYVRALIRDDMKNEEEAKYVYKGLLKSADDIAAGRTYSAEEVMKHTDRLLAKLEAEEAGK